MEYKKYNDIIIELIKEGKDSKYIFECIERIGYNSSYKSFRKYLERIKKRIGVIKDQKDITDIDKKIIKILETKKVIKTNDLLNILKCNKKDLIKYIKNCSRFGYEIQEDNDNIIFSNTNVRQAEKITKLSCNEIEFGIVSDTHFGSKSCQLTALNEFCEIMKKKGIKHIFVPGDMVAGYGVYPGQVHDLYAVSAQAQQDSVLVNLPSGFEWYVLGGNHDYSFIKSGGYNIISVLSSRRSDIHYVGFDEANVPILNNVDVKLVHPSGGVPYSISYRLQKNIEQITISELQSIVRNVKDKPTTRFVLLGHLHIQMQAMFGSIWGAQCGTFEGQTNYLKRKGLIPSIGGWIVKATLGKNGLLKNFDSKYYLFDEIEDDWKNYKHSLPDKKITIPIFEN